MAGSIPRGDAQPVIDRFLRSSSFIASTRSRTPVRAAGSQANHQRGADHRPVRAEGERLQHVHRRRQPGAGENGHRRSGEGARDVRQHLQRRDGVVDDLAAVVAHDHGGGAAVSSGERVTRGEHALHDERQLRLLPDVSELARRNRRHVRLPDRLVARAHAIERVHVDADSDGAPLLRIPHRGQDAIAFAIRLDDDQRRRAGVDDRLHLLRRGHAKPHEALRIAKALGNRFEVAGAVLRAVTPRGGRGRARSRAARR